MCLEVNAYEFQSYEGLINLFMNNLCLIIRNNTHSVIGVDFGGRPGHVTPIIEKRLSFHLLLPLLPYSTFWFASPIFCTSLRQCTGACTAASTLFGSLVNEL